MPLAPLSRIQLCPLLAVSSRPLTVNMQAAAYSLGETLRTLRRHELAACLVAICGVLSMEAFAHHGVVSNGALYLADDFIELDGEVTEIFWRNPHVRGRMPAISTFHAFTTNSWSPGPNRLNLNAPLASALIWRVERILTLFSCDTQFKKTCAPSKV